MSVLTSILTVLVFTFLPAQEERSPRQMKNSAILLANRIPLLPQHEAYNYLDIFYEHLDQCLVDSPLLGPVQSSTCVRAATAQVAAALEEADPNRFVRIRLNDMNRAGVAMDIPAFPDVNKPTMGVVGDSLIVGSMSADNLEPNILRLIYTGVTKSSSDASIPDQEMDANDRVIRLLGPNASSLGAQYIDCEECSFAYDLGLSLDVPPANMFFVAQQGARIDTLLTQLKLLTQPLGHLPDYLVISYTANDFCSGDNVKIDAQRKYRDYSKKMKEDLLRAARQLQPSPRGTEIIFVGGADVMNVFRNEKILDKEISYLYFTDYPRKVTCRDMRQQSLNGAKLLNNICPYVMETRLDDEERIAHIDALHSAVINAQRDSIEFIRSKNFPNLRYQFIDQILDIDFDGEDISSDCFHPTWKGHKKIADKMLGTIR